MGIVSLTVRLGLIITLPFATAVLAAQHLTVTWTNSLPPGIYGKSSVRESGPRVGEIVLACVPQKYATFGRAHGFLDVGPCDGTEPILKLVEARPGDRVVLTAAGVFVHGKRLEGSTPVNRSATGITLPHVPFQTYFLGPGQYWLGTPKTNGFDSRYFGPVDHILALARPLIVFDI